MDLSKFPRRNYIKHPTLLEPMRQLSKFLGNNVDIWIKRDDLLPGLAGGNKTRKLDFCIGDAIAKGADTLITCGALQSNHCRLTASFAQYENLDCHLIIRELENKKYNPNASGNNFLYNILVDKKNIHVISFDEDANQEMEKLSEELKNKGKKPYIIPLGGSNIVGSLGYVAFVDELMHQIKELNLKVDGIVVASGSIGTHAGIATGLFGNNVNIPLTGINISKLDNLQEQRAFDLASELTEKLFLPSIPRERIVCVNDYLGSGYSIPTDEMKEAVLLFAKHEGILLDPVYSGKAAAGLIDFVRKGRYDKGSTVIFVHTGGSPAIYSYQEFFEK